MNACTSNVNTAASNSNSICPITSDFTRTPPAQRFDNNANNNSSSSHGNTSDTDADTLDNSGTNITPPVHTSPSTTTLDNEPEPE